MSVPHTVHDRIRMDQWRHDRRVYMATFVFKLTNKPKPIITNLNHYWQGEVMQKKV